LGTEPDEAEARRIFEEALTRRESDDAASFLYRLIGVEYSISDGICVAQAPVRGLFRNLHGAMHGGILATILDMAMGRLLLQHYGTGGATLELKVQYMKPVSSGTIRCEARFLKAGRSIAFMEGKIVDDRGDLVASATATWKPALRKSS
jgi:uncharacterized protein (TIGR00369 family)